MCGRIFFSLPFFNQRIRETNRYNKYPILTITPRICLGIVFRFCSNKNLIYDGFDAIFCKRCHNGITLMVSLSVKMNENDSQRLTIKFCWQISFVHAKNDHVYYFEKNVFTNELALGAFQGNFNK